ncbi:MAG: aromatic ring-hydroxylating dioxygenase subunit alpha [Planctomycetaceae bacterium]
MFVNQRYLQYLLRPEHYCGSEHYECELAELFRPAWQLVAAASELSRPGSFRTLELFGEPLQIRNVDGRLVAFQNVCPHRHCLLTHDRHGCSETIRCQYHGWEFNATGRTGRIPDARCFRPWDRDNACLKMYRLEACGDLLFVNLTADAVPLREWLAPYFDETQQVFQSPLWKMKHVWEYDCDCNWKVPAENTLESYHVPALHRKSLGNFLPTEEASHHTLHDRYTALDYDACSRLEALQARLNRWLGGTPTMQYRHRHIHPNLILCSTDTINYALTYQPTSPSTVHIRVLFYAIRGHRRDPLSQFMSWAAWRIAKAKTLEVHREDIDIYAAQQRGLEVSRHRGVIGTREERIFQFQSYVLHSLNLPLPAPMDADEADSHRESAETATESVPESWQ